MNQELMDMAKQAHQKLVSEVYVGHTGQLDPWTMELLKIFAALVAAAERERITAMLMYLHNQASAYHNYYKHAAIEISWKGDASKGTVLKDYSIGETK
jgi:hypothetical protein